VYHGVLSGAVQLTLGGVPSRYTVTLCEAVPPALVAEHVSVVPDDGVSAPMVVGPQPVIDETADSTSITVHVTVIVPLHQPALPESLHETFRVISGGVVSDGVAVGARLKITVSSALGSMTAEHGFVISSHVFDKRFFAPIQPANTEPEAALAVKVTVALWLDVLMFGEHSLVTVCDDCGVPVPPQDVGASTVPEFGVIVTEPAPVPANFRTQLRTASVNAPTSETPDSSPVAVYV
jgi:hypothetical protein